VNMASSNSQEEYIHTLRQIKESEEKTYGEIEVHKKQVEQEIKNLHNDLKNTIDMTKQEGEKMLEKSIGESRNNAFREAEDIVNDAENKSKSISFQLDKQVVKDIMEILFSDIK
jgi:vacuolar-type H+-ATPase subunit H